jgi:hypothetical protein
MIQRVVRIAPLQAGKVSAVLYGMVSLFIVPFFMLPGFLGAKNAMPVWVPLLFIPVYVIAGFVMSVLMAWLYNLIAGWVGGIEVTTVLDVTAKACP